MHTIIKLPKLFYRYLRLSAVNLIQFPFEIIMKIIDLLFSILFLYTFWYSMSYLDIIIPGWNNYELIILSGVGMISNGIGQITFGFRDLEYAVINGSLDKYLVRPLHPLLSVVFEKLFIFWIVFQVIAGLIMIAVSTYQSKIVLINIVPSILILILGSFSYQMIFGCFTLLTFWVGKISSARNMIFSISDAKKYPLDIFPAKIYSIFIWLLPISFLATIPTKVILGKLTNSWNWVSIACLILLFWVFMLNFIWRRAIKRYESTGS